MFQAVKYCPETIQMAQLVGGCKGVGSIGLDCYSPCNSKIRSSVESLITWHLVKSLKATLKQINDKHINAYGRKEINFTSSLSCLGKHFQILKRKH